MGDIGQFDRRLLEFIENGVPLVREPYAQIAADLAMDERAVLEHLNVLRGPQGVVREISGIFDAVAMGYRQTLAAFRVKDDALDAAGRTVADHPGVSHCYGRAGLYNLWFTLAVAPASQVGLNGTVDVLARRVGAEARMALPTIRKYKLRVRFASRSAENDSDPSDIAAGAPSPEMPVRRLTAEQKQAVSALQRDLPNRSDPFAELAGEVGLNADMLLVHAADLLAGGYLRRYAAVLHHRQAGASQNVLVAWSVDTNQADKVGRQCAAHAAVSHCYLRGTSEGWPYNLYTMIHGETVADCEATIGRIAAETGLVDRVDLWTVREYKKQRVRFFDGRQEQWENEARRRGLLD